MKSLQTRFSWAIVIAAILPVGVVLGWFIHHAAFQMRSYINENMVDILDLKRQVLTEHAEEIHGYGTMLTANPMLRAEMSEFLKDSGHASAPMTSSAMATLQSESWGQIHHIFLTDGQGQVLLSPPHDDEATAHLGENLGMLREYQRALHEPLLTDLFSFREQHHLHQLSLTPVSANGEGVIVIEICNDFMVQTLLE